MLQGYVIDSNGYFIEDYIIADGEDYPSSVVTVEMDGSLHSPRFVDGIWVEGLSQEDLNRDVYDSEISKLSDIESAELIGFEIDNIIITGNVMFLLLSSSGNISLLSKNDELVSVDVDSMISDIKNYISSVQLRHWNFRKDLKSRLL